MNTLRELWEEAGKKEKKHYKIKERDFYLVFFSAVVGSLSSFFLNKTDFANAKPLFGNMFFNYILTAFIIVFFIIILIAVTMFIFRFLNKLGTFLVLVWKKLKIRKKYRRERDSKTLYNRREKYTRNSTKF